MIHYKLNQDLMNDSSYINLYALSDDRIIDLVCEFVRKTRLDKQFSQQELSDAAGISRSTLSLIERGTSPTLDTLVKVLRALGSLEALSGLKYEKVVSPLQVAEENMKERYRVRKKSGNMDTEESEW